jgi:hypothetical protein
LIGAAPRLPTTNPMSLPGEVLKRREPRLLDLSMQVTMSK